MIEFQLHTLETAPAMSRAVLEDGGMEKGNLPNMIRTIAESPAALTGFQRLRQAFSESSLTSLEQQIVYITVSKANSCHYCLTQTGLFDDSEDARAMSAAIIADQPLPDTRLQALRRFTNAVAAGRGWVPDDSVEAFFTAGFDRAQILDVITGVAIATMSNYVNHIAATPIDGNSPREYLDG